MTLYERMLLIRRFEERLLELFAEGVVSGTTHACIGQEHISAGLFAHLTTNDIVFSNHRCHGHYLAHQDDPDGLMAELLGKATGTCGGIGGSQHLQRGNFYTNGVQGGVVTAAVGMALATKLQRQDHLTVVFLGDGTLGQGQVYEAMNLASLWQLKVLFVIENNGYSQSTPSHLQIAGSIRARPEAFGIPVLEVTSNDVRESHATAREAVARARAEGPTALLYHTFRLCSHSRSDDGRPSSVVDPWRSKDPLQLAEPDGDSSKVVARVEEAIRKAREAPEPGAQPTALPVPTQVPGTSQTGEKIVTVLNRAHHRLLREDPRAVMVGMDILDPYGGAFKVEKGLSTAFPERVIPTPVCEQSLTGLCGGLALRGLHPVLQIMFGDFLTLAVEPLVNYICKYRGMYNDQVRCPVVIRTPMGGRRGYGPTHSQSLEKLVFGVPDLRIVAVSPVHDVESLFLTAVMHDEAPVLFLENKLLYTRPLMLPDEEGWIGSFATAADPAPYPTRVLSPTEFRRADAVIATYGGMTEICLEAAERLLLEHEKAVEVVVFSQIQPLPVSALQPSLQRAPVLVTVEEGVKDSGWGAEVVAACAERGWVRKSARVGALNAPIPAARTLEENVLPQTDDVISAVLKTL